MIRRKRIYMDYASATPVDPRVKAHMAKFEKNIFANPDALHKEGREAKEILENAHKIVAAILRARASEIIFTSGATESNNLALIGVVKSALPDFQKSNKRPHIIVSSVEHKSVLEVARHLETLGVDVSYVAPDESGIISPKDIRAALRPETILVSIAYANNEIGTIQPIAEIAKEIRHFKKIAGNSKPLSFPLFHTDATQAFNYCDMNVIKLGVDLLTINSPKVYGPVGIGALYIKQGTSINPIVFGGGQEMGMRSGRELPLLASGFAYALQISEKEKQREVSRLTKLRDYFFKKIIEIDPNIKINGGLESRLPNNVNICIPNLDAEFAVYQLDERGVACSSVSTCVNLSAESYSYVIEEIKPKTNCSSSSLRFSLGRWSKKTDVDYCLKALRDVILSQRKHLWNKSLNNK